MWINKQRWTFIFSFVSSKLYIIRPSVFPFVGIVIQNNGHARRKAMCTNFQVTYPISVLPNPEHSLFKEIDKII
jgi:hypothetical protein